MKRSREELGRIHKEKCKELKKVRAKIAADLGVALHQRECTYEGYCSGTCPKCMQEELMLNAAIARKQLEESNLKSRVAAAGLTTVAAVCLSGCNVTDSHQLDGDMQYIPEETVEPMEGEVIEPDMEILEGKLVIPETPEVESSESKVPEVELPETEIPESESAEPDGTESAVVELEGDVLYIPTEEWELAGEVPVYDEATYEEAE